MISDVIKTLTEYTSQNRYCNVEHYIVNTDNKKKIKLKTCSTQKFFMFLITLISFRYKNWLIFCLIVSNMQLNKT